MFSGKYKFGGVKKYQKGKRAPFRLTCVAQKFLCLTSVPTLFQVTLTVETKVARRLLRSLDFDDLTDNNGL